MHGKAAAGTKWGINALITEEEGVRRLRDIFYEAQMMSKRRIKIGKVKKKDYNKDKNRNMGHFPKCCQISHFGIFVKNVRYLA